MRGMHGEVKFGAAIQIKKEIRMKVVNQLLQTHDHLLQTAESRRYFYRKEKWRRHPDLNRFPVYICLILWIIILPNYELHNVCTTQTCLRDTICIRSLTVMIRILGGMGTFGFDCDRCWHVALMSIN